MNWLGLALMLIGLVVLFAIWDILFGRGRRSRALASRIIELAPWRFRSRPPQNGERR